LSKDCAHFGTNIEQTWDKHGTNLNSVAAGMKVARLTFEISVIAGYGSSRLNPLSIRIPPPA
jgi:hypothetical protein